MYQEKKEVSHYGIHRDQDKVAWLEQGRAGVNAYGLKEKSPFTVRLPQGRHCNHQINLSSPVPNDRHWELFLQLQTDPLVRAMMPFPKTDAGLFYLEDRPRLTDFLAMLSRMSSPIYPVVLPFSFTEREDILRALSESNVQPHAIYGAKVEDISKVREVGTVAGHRPGKLVMTGLKELVLPMTVRKIDTELTTDKFGSFNELNAFPWENIGAHSVKKWMRSEWAGENTVNVRAERSVSRPEQPTRNSEGTARVG